MAFAAITKHLFPPQPAPEPVYDEWRGTDDTLSARSRRRSTLVLFLIIWIALVDLAWPRTNVSILYVAPLLLMARSGNPIAVWRVAGISAILTFFIYLLKNSIFPSGNGAEFWDYRVINRTFVVLALGGMARALQHWIRWREEQLDQELSDVVRYQDRDISSTVALLCCVPMIVVIAAVDILTPPRVNMAIFYSIPLFICGWTRNRGLLWAVFGMLAILAVAGFLWDLPDATPLAASLRRNRLLALTSMAVVAVVLDYWLSRDEPEESRS